MSMSAGGWWKTGSTTASSSATTCPTPTIRSTPTSAVRLVRTHEIVRDALGLNRPAIANPVVSFDQTQPYYDAER